MSGLHREVGTAGETKVNRGCSARLHPDPRAGAGYLPALLQSTRKELFWPTKAFERPAPLEVTLLASEDALGMALKQVSVDDLVTDSTRMDEVSLAAPGLTRRWPRRWKEGEVGVNGQSQWVLSARRGEGPGRKL